MLEQSKTEKRFFREVKSNKQANKQKQTNEKGLRALIVLLFLLLQTKGLLT